MQELDLRILMYSCGMGGALRCLAMASHVFEQLPAASVLALTDLPILGRFPLPANFDYVHMPALDPGSADAELTPHLRSGSAALRLRRTIAATTLESFDPELVVVDRYPLGLQGELAAALGALRERGSRTRLVAGLPDILGDPESVRSAWETAGVAAALSSLYDEIWIYGASDVFDTASAYPLPQGIERVYTGYFRHWVDADVARSKVLREGLDVERPVVLVSAGSGKGGFPLLSTYLDFLEKQAGDCVFQSHLVCGPFMPTRDRKLLEERSRGLGPVYLNTFHTSLMPYLHAAHLVIANFGYNTCCELLSLGKRAIVVPSEQATSEQGLRARVMTRRGLVELLEPDELDRERLGELVMGSLRGSARPRRDVLLDGLENVARRVEGLAARSR